MRPIDRTGFTFLMTDLAVGLRFARRAASQHKQDIRSREIRNARHAYQTSLRFSPRLQLGERERQDLEGRTQELKFALEELGEVL